LVVVVGVVGAQCLAAQNKPFVECDRAELVQAVPELAGIQFEPSEDRLDGLLDATGDRLGRMFAKLVGFSASEEIHEMRFEDSMGEASRRERFRYVVRPPEEFRTDPNSDLAVQVPPKSDFLVAGHFFRLLRYLLPEYRDQSRFRYLGRWKGSGQDDFVVAFAQRPEGTELPSHIQIGGGRTASLQGLVWIDSATNRIVRLRLDLLGHLEDFPFKTLTTDLSLAPMNFPSMGTEFLLLARVTVHARYGEGEVHSVHRYSGYRLAGAAEESHASITTPEAASAEDSWELLGRGISLVRENKLRKPSPHCKKR